MKTSSKIVLIILALLAVAFAAGVGGSLMRGSEDEKKKLTQKEQQDLMDGWVGSLGRSLDFLSPSLDISRLRPPAPCRKGQKSFRLTNDTACLVRISEKEGGLWDWIDFEKMSLRPASARMSLQMCRCEEDDGTRSRGAGLRVRPKKLVTLSDRLKIPANVATAVIVQGGPQLEVSYFPQGEAVSSDCRGNEALVCEVVTTASLVVLDEGGTLRLACDGCSEAKPAEVRLE
jgi:hypothetical protein